MSDWKILLVFASALAVGYAAVEYVNAEVDTLFVPLVKAPEGPYKRKP